jgi:GNAT superfamily N-acetyltransferase
MPPAIRTATPADVPAILRLLRELAEFEHLSHACIATETLLDKHLFGPSPAAEALVATEGNQVMGYAIYFRTFSTFLALPGLYLEDLYIQPPFRRRGLAKAMLSKICQIAVDRGFGRVEWAVLKWNQHAITFYESIGAIPLAEWQGYRLSGTPLLQAAQLP